MSQQKPKISTSFSYETLEETLDIKPKSLGMMIGIPKGNRLPGKPYRVDAGCRKCTGK